MTDAPRWPIPTGAPRRPCHSCGTPICLVRTEGGRWMPVELDGVSHFDRCSSAAEHRAQLRNLVLALTHEERRVLEAIRRGEPLRLTGALGRAHRQLVERGLIALSTSGARYDVTSAGSSALAAFVVGGGRR